jgi:hypothetical protein
MKRLLMSALVGFALCSTASASFAARGHGASSHGGAHHASASAAHRGLRQAASTSRPGRRHSAYRGASVQKQPVGFFVSENVPRPLVAGAAFY